MLSVIMVIKMQRFIQLNTIIKSISFVVFILSVFLPEFAIAEDYKDALHLKEACETALHYDGKPKEVYDAYQTGYCGGVISGVVFSASRFNQLDGCKGVDLAVEKDIQTFLKWTNNNPNQLSVAAPDAVLISMLEFCNKQK